MKTLKTLLLLLPLYSYSQTAFNWNGGSGNWNSSANWIPSGIPGNTDTVYISAAGTYTISSIPSNYTLGKIQVSNNAQVTLQHTGGRTLTLSNAGNNGLVISAGANLVLGNNMTLTMGNNTLASIAGQLTVGNGRTFNSNNGGVISTVTGVLQNAGTVNSSVATRLVFTAGSQYEHARNGGNLPIASWDPASECLISGVTSTVPGNRNQVVGHFVWACSGQSSALFLSGAPSAIQGDLRITRTGGNHLFLGGSNVTTTFNIEGNLIVGDNSYTAICDMDNSNGTITINLKGGLYSYGNTGGIDNSGWQNSVLNFTRASGIQVIHLENPSTFLSNWGGRFNIGDGSNSNQVNLETNVSLAPYFYTYVTVKNGSMLNMGDKVISNAGEFTCNSGAILGIGHPQGISQSAMSGNVQVNNTRSYASGATYIYNGSQAQVTGDGLPSSVYRLYIKNSSGISAGTGVTLSQGVSITGTLQLDAGLLNVPGAGLLVLTSTASAIHYSDASFVSGSMDKDGNTDFEFPTGKAGAGLIPVKLSGLSSSALFRARYFAAPASALGPVTAAGLDHVSHCEYWTLDRVSGTASANVSLYWNAHSPCNAAVYVNQLSDLVVAHFNGSNWNSMGADGGRTGNASSGTVTWNNISSFSPFSLGGTSAYTNPLPVTLTDLQLHILYSGIRLSWIQRTESEVNDYVIERSADGVHFVSAGRLSALYNDGGTHHYDFTDSNTLGINSNTLYYRIAINSTGLPVRYSRVVPVTIGDTHPGPGVFPNPVTGNQVWFTQSLWNGKFVRLRLFDISGKLVQQGEGAVIKGGEYRLPEGLEAGIYYLQAETAGVSASIKLVKL